MKTSLISLLLVLTSLSHAQEAAPPKTYGQIYATVDITDKISDAVADKNGKVFLATSQGTLQILSAEGKIEKTSKLPSEPGKAGFLILLRDGNIFFTHSKAPMVQAINIIDQNGTVTKSSSCAANPFNYPLELKSGNIALPCGNMIYVLSPDLTEVMKFNTKYPSGLHAFELPDGSVVFSDVFSIYIVDPSLKVNPVEIGSPGNAMHLDTTRRDGTIVVTLNDEQFRIYDKSGKQLLSVKQDGHRYIELPDGTLVGRTDTNLPFLDKDGKLKTNYQHDSVQASSVFNVGKDVIAYANSSEIVFVNNKGEELGTLPFAREIASRFRFLDLGNNRYAVFQAGGTKIVFLKH